MQTSDQSASQRFVIHKSTNLSIVDNSNTLIFNTRKLNIPRLSTKSRAFLDENQFIVTRSKKTKNAFLYSSPWAALSAFDSESSFKETEVVVRAFPSNGNTLKSDL